MELEKPFFKHTRNMWYKKNVNVNFFFSSKLFARINDKPLFIINQI